MSFFSLIHWVSPRRKPYFSAVMLLITSAVISVLEIADKVASELVNHSWPRSCSSSLLVAPVTGLTWLTNEAGIAMVPMVVNPVKEVHHVLFSSTHGVKKKITGVAISQSSTMLCLDIFTASTAKNSSLQS